MLYVLFCTFNNLYIFIPNRSENKVKANIKKRRRKERKRKERKKRKVLLAYKKAVKYDYEFPPSPLPGSRDCIPLGFYILV